MNRAVRAVALSLSVAGLAALAACSSTAGSGSRAVGPSSAATSATASTDSTSPSPSSGSATATAGGGGGNTPVAAPPPTAPGSTATPPSSASPPVSSPTSSAPPALPEITSGPEYTVHCTSMTGTSTVDLSWTSKNATEAWLEQVAVASAGVGADPKNDGGVGPLSPNGNKTLPFDCTEDYGYYVLEVYNSAGQKSGIVQQVPRNV